MLKACSLVCRLEIRCLFVPRVQSLDLDREHCVHMQVDLLPDPPQSLLLTAKSTKKQSRPGIALGEGAGVGVLTCRRPQTPDGLILWPSGSCINQCPPWSGPNHLSSFSTLTAIGSAHTCFSLSLLTRSPLSEDPFLKEATSALPSSL